LTRPQLDNISHDFPNLTETAMPIKSMKARYYYLQGNKEEAYQMIDQGAKDNPQIFFSENLKSQFLFQEGKLDSAYVYAKRAFDGLPNNMPHYDMYMKTLVAKRDLTSLDQTFEKMISLAGNKKIIWTIYIRSLAQTRSLGDPFAMDKAASAYQLYPNDETIFSLYRLLTYGQQRMVEAENLSNQATVAYNNKEYGKAATLFFQAFDKDPLQHTYSLNAGLGYFESKQYDKAIQFFDLALTSKKESTKEKALRYKGLSMYSLGRGPEACAVFLVLRNKYPKRMYQQELQKYCLTKN
jgi:tetratricopeptide (TPR) repeat protein